MAREMKMEIIQRETVKPSSPTPDKFRTYQLSFLDQLAPNYPIQLLLFYPQATRLMSVSQTSQLLIKSLSQTLTRFHHFAGRRKDDVSVECNDAGAEFTATQSDRPLSSILTNPDFSSLMQFVGFPTPPDYPLLLIKANFFSCGGLAIGVCLSHCVADAATLCMFLKSWATEASNPELKPKLIPNFIAPAIFPPIKSFGPLVEPSQLSDANEDIKLTRMVFDRTGIQSLRTKVESESSVTNPTRVEVVSALIWKCAIEARLESDGKSYSSFLHSVNIRKRMSPSLPENSAGSLVWHYEMKIPSREEAGKIDLKDLAILLRNGIDEFKAIWRSGAPVEELKSSMKERVMMKSSGGGRCIIATSWCRYPFYEMDFGWGNPVWICLPVLLLVKNGCMMMDTRDGDGIEVILTLGAEEMKHFQTNQELLAFATLDPAIII